MLDRYSKAVLTVIALALVALCVEGWLYERAPPIYRVVLGPQPSSPAPYADSSPSADFTAAARKGLDEAVKQSQ